MAVNASNVRIFVWKIIKISSITCFNITTNHPCITSSSLFFLLLYIFCPLFFWILILSLPPVWIGFKIKTRNRRRTEKDDKTKSDAGDQSIDRRKKAFSRVHSVRRRKAKEITIEEDDSKRDSKAKQNVGEDEEKEEEEAEEEGEKYQISRKVLAEVEESPKEIHEVEVEAGRNQEFYHNPDLMRSLQLLMDDEDTRDEANKAMDVGISDADRTKRLESLIARRQFRKVLNQQVRRSLMSNDPAPVPPPLPKINTRCSPSRAGGGQFSPVPGSAPSVMIPMRNPFDLPYDPQEEKLDLTGDSFQQEFAMGMGHGREMMFCRHESFSLGPSLPFEFSHDKPSIDDFGFRRRGYHFSKPENEESDMDFGHTTDAESGVEHESDSNIDSPDEDEDEHHDDQIKEVIQVHENGDDTKSHAHAQDELSLTSKSKSNSNSSSSSVVSSEEDERPVRIINREAILKSLSMRRNSVDIDINTNDNLQENNLTYANSALENASRLKQEYFAHKPQKRHGMTFSIASDMQVEVSEMSSPPLTIDESMSYRDDTSTFEGEMDRNTSWDGLDSWAGSSRMSEVSDNETRLARARRPGGLPPHSIHPSSSAGEFSDNEAQMTDITNQNGNTMLEANEVEENNVNIGEGINVNAINTDNPAPEASVHQTTISPKSVLQPTLSVASFEPDADDEAQLSRVTQNVTPSQFTFVASSSGDAQASQEHSRPPSNPSTSGGKDPESSASNGKQKILETVERTEEVGGSSSSSQMLGIQEPPAQTIDEELKNQENSGDFEAANPNHEMGNPSKPEDLESNSTSSNHPDDKKD